MVVIRFAGVVTGERSRAGTAGRIGPVDDPSPTFDVVGSTFGGARALDRPWCCWFPETAVGSPPGRCTRPRGPLVLAFGVVLLLSVSLSGIAARTILSTALMFLLAGAVLGQGGLGLVEIVSVSPFVAAFADIALFTVLFADGQRACLPALRDAWRVSGRVLGLAMPLTMVGIAVPAHFLVGLGWPTAFLVGAILSPTAMPRAYPANRAPTHGSGRWQVTGSSALSAPAPRTCSPWL
jgi:hypothetical protein